MGHALLRCGAQCGVTEFSNSHAEELSEAESFCAIWGQNGGVLCSRLSMLLLLFRTCTPAE